MLRDVNGARHSGRQRRRMSGVERRAGIEQAAAGVFAEHGYAPASLDDIAEAAGISKRVIYDHFESKRELHASLIERQTAALWAFVAERVQTEHTVELRVRAGADAFFRFVETHPDAWRMLFRDPPSDADSVALHRRLQAQTTSAIAALLSADPAAQHAVATAEARTLEMTAEMLKSTLNGLASWWYEHRDTPRADLVSAVMGYSWLGLQRLGEGGRWREPDEIAAPPPNERQ